MMTINYKLLDPQTETFWNRVFPVNVFLGSHPYGTKWPLHGNIQRFFWTFLHCSEWFHNSALGHNHLDINPNWTFIAFTLSAGRFLQQKRCKIKLSRAIKPLKFPTAGTTYLNTSNYCIKCIAIDAVKLECLNLKFDIIRAKFEVPRIGMSCISPPHLSNSIYSSHLAILGVLIKWPVTKNLHFISKY